MRVLFHPEFPQDVRRYAHTYNEISSGLAVRFVTRPLKIGSFGGSHTTTWVL